MNEQSNSYISELISSTVTTTMKNNLPQIIDSLKEIPNFDTDQLLPLTQAIHVSVQISTQVSFEILRQFGLVKIAPDDSFFVKPNLTVFSSDNE